MVDTRHTSIVNYIYKATNITGGATLCERKKIMASTWSTAEADGQNVLFGVILSYPF